MQQRAAKARTAGRTAVYTYLNDRVTFRKGLVTTLEQRQKDMAAVADWCASQGLKADADGTGDAS